MDYEIGKAFGAKARSEDRHHKRHDPADGHVYVRVLDHYGRRYWRRGGAGMSDYKKLKDLCKDAETSECPHLSYIDGPGELCRLATFVCENPGYILALIAENEALKASSNHWKNWADHFFSEMCREFGFARNPEYWARDTFAIRKHISKIIKALSCKNKELRKDAERYRWLREKDWIQVEVGVRCGSSETLTEMDECIDSAMGKGEQS